MSTESKIENINWNAQRWGNDQKWFNHDHYGYQWGSGLKQASSGISKFADAFLRPVLMEIFPDEKRYALDILEIAPGAGRFTAELIRYAASLDLVDLNEACLNICKERFKYFPLPIGYHKNDGESLSMLHGKKFDLIASFDSMVHVHPVVLEHYFEQCADLLAVNGVLFIDHSGKGEKKLGHRTNVFSDEAMAWVDKFGLTLHNQLFRNDHDCITIAVKKNY